MPVVDLLPYRLRDLEDPEKRAALCDDLADQYPALREFFARAALIMEAADDADDLRFDCESLHDDVLALQARVAVLEEELVSLR